MYWHCDHVLGLPCGSTSLALDLTVLRGDQPSRDFDAPVDPRSRLDDPLKRSVELLGNKNVTPAGQRVKMAPPRQKYPPHYVMYRRKTGQLLTENRQIGRATASASGHRSGDRLLARGGSLHLRWQDN